MDVAQITDKKEIAYMLVQAQQRLLVEQRNCQVLEQRLAQLEQAEQQPSAEPKAEGDGDESPDVD